MNIVLIGAVEEGWLIFKEMLSRKEHYNDIAAIITIDEDDTTHISGYADFEALAKEYNKPFYKIKHIRTPDAYQLIKSLSPDLIMVMGWSQLVGDDVLALPQLGCIGLHTTLLPRHRGRAPIPWAIIKGLGRSGNTLFYFTPGVDNGDIIGRKYFYITQSDTAKIVYDKATRAGIDLVIESLPEIKNGTASRIKQDENIADHWPRRRPKDGLIDWSAPASQIYNLIRAVTKPYPGAFTFINGKKLIIWKSEMLAVKETELNILPGKILDIAFYENGFIAGTGDGILLISEVEDEAGNILTGKDYLMQNHIAIGLTFANNL